MNNEAVEIVKARQAQRRATSDELASAHRKELIAAMLRNSSHANLSSATCDLLANAIHAAVIAPLESALATTEPAACRHNVMVANAPWECADCGYVYFA